MGGEFLGRKPSGFSLGPSDSKTYCLEGLLYQGEHCFFCLSLGAIGRMQKHVPWHAAFHPFWNVIPALANVSPVLS